MKVLLAIPVALLLAAPATAAVQWSAPQVVARDAVRYTAPAVAANARGDALIAYRTSGDRQEAVAVVWRDHRGRVGRRQTLGEGFDPAFDVALADDGRGFVAWVDEQEEDDLTYDVMLAEAPPGGRFGPPLKVEEVFGSIPDEVHLKTEAGRVVLAYNDGRDVGVVARSGPGAPFGPLETYEDYEARDPDVAMNARGDAVVSWLSKRALKSVRIRDGGFGALRTLARTGIAGYLRTGLGARDTLLAAWQGNWEEHVSIDRHYGAIRAQAVARGRALPVGHVERARRSERKGPQKPDLAVAPDGSGVVVWQRVLRPEGVRHALRGRIVAARLDRLGRIGPSRALSTPRAIATDARISTDGRGRSVAVWQQVPPESLSRPLRLVAATAARRGRFGAPRFVVRPGEKAELHTLTAHDRGFLLAYARRTGRFTATIALRSGR